MPSPPAPVDLPAFVPPDPPVWAREPLEALVADELPRESPVPVSRPLRLPPGLAVAGVVATVAAAPAAAPRALPVVEPATAPVPLEEPVEAPPARVARLFVEQQRLRVNLTRYRIEVTYADGTSEELWASQKWFSKTGHDDIVCRMGSLDGPDCFRVRCSEFRSYLKGSYAVEDGDGAEIGRIAIRRKESLLRTQWVTLDDRGVEGVRARERNVPIAIVRRARSLVGFIPVLGPVAGVVLDVVPIPYHFDLLHAGGPVGAVQRQRTIRDRYTVDVTPDTPVDPRLVVALSLCVDGLQGR